MHQIRTRDIIITIELNVDEINKFRNDKFKSLRMNHPLLVLAFLDIDCPCSSAGRAYD